MSLPECPFGLPDSVRAPEISGAAAEFGSAKSLEGGAAAAVGDSAPPRFEGPQLPQVAGPLPQAAGPLPQAAGQLPQVAGPLPQVAGPRLVRLRVDLSYDGTHFAGWAEQPGRRTVAGELGVALAILFRIRVPVMVAGRTDAGVHATGQVAHIDVDPRALVALARRSGDSATADPVQRGMVGLLRRLSGLLPLDVRVRRISLAADGFDARFGALRRHYRYRIAATGFGAEPLRRFDTLAWPRPLMIGPMIEASRTLLGLHDFAAYCKPPAHDRASTIRQLQRLTIDAPAGEDGVIAVDVTADAFCHSMVRSLVGVLLAVGEGRTPVERPAELLAARLRTSAIHPAPAHGLTLVQVDYPPDAELRTRAAMTRAVRQPAP